MNGTSDDKELRGILDSIIEINNMYGWSFTYGSALRIAMRQQYLTTDLDEMVLSMLEDLYEEILDLMTKAGMRVDGYSLADVIDISVLDSIAREIIGEDEN